MIENYVDSIQPEGEKAPSPAEREQLFRRSQDWLAGVMPNVMQSFAAFAKDRAADWLR